MPARATGPVLTARFVQTSVWSTGYGADYILSNSGDAASTTWMVEFDLPAGSRVTSSWSSVRTQTGQHYRFTNAGYNGDIIPGASESFGFNVSGLGMPTGCTVNAAPCAGGGGPAETSPPATPTNLRSVGVTASSVSLTWNASTDNVGVTGYEVLTGTTVRTSVTATSATVGGLAAATAYAFTLRAKDAAGNHLSRQRPGHRHDERQRRRRVHGGRRHRGGTPVGARGRPARADHPAGRRHVPGRVPRAAAGTAAAPITLTGPASAILVNDGPSGSAPSCPAPTAGWDPGYALWLFDAPNWNLNGFTVADSKKGIVLDNSHHVSVAGVYVHHVEDEAVHFRRSSADGVIRDSRIEHTGLVQPGFGEGVYIGSAGSNWACHGNSGGVDRSDRVQVLNNRIGPNVAAEGIDVKEGTHNGLIRGNTFDGRGLSGQNSADSWVDVKGIGYLIEGNTGTFTIPATFVNGYETHNPTTTPSLGNGCGNTWRSNSSNLGRGGPVRHPDHVDVEVHRQPQRRVRVQHGDQRDHRADEHRRHALTCPAGTAKIRVIMRMERSHSVDHDP